MTKAAAVANLNEAAGKSSDQKRLRVEDINFSPYKKARTAAAVKQAIKTLPKDAQNSPSAYSTPLDGDTENRSIALHKKTRDLKAKRVDKDVNSPLKSTGFDPAEISLPKHLNLEDTPAKNTRSRTYLPPDNILPKKRSVGSTARRSKTAAPLEVMIADRDPGNISAVSPDDSSEDAARSSEQSGSDDDGNESNEIEDELLPAATLVQENNSDLPKSNKSKDHILGTLSTKLNADKAIGKEQESGEQFEGDTDGQLGETAPVTSQNGIPEQAEVDGVEVSRPQNEADEVEDQHTRCGEKFVRSIGCAAHWHHCSNAWSSIGGAALIVRGEFGGLQPTSTWCRALYRRSKEIKTACKDHRKGAISELEVDQAISNSIGRLKALCKEIPTVKTTAVRNQIVLDLYKHAVPEIVMVLAAYLRAYGRSDLPFEGVLLRDFVQLLRVASNLSNQAADWVPRPSTLDKGLAQSLRRRTRPALQQILKKFSSQLNHLQRRTRTHSALDELRAAQLATLEALQIRRDSMYGKANRDAFRPPTRLRSNDGHTHGNDNVTIATVTGEGEGDTVVNPPSRTRLERQATEEIVPPPMDWTEDEKTSLLNALEHFRGEDRYWQISKACSELHDRSIEELRAAALYFKELVVSAPEFVEHLDSDFPYLLSVE